MNSRLILAIVSTLLEEAVLAVVVLVGLPELGINIPLPVLIALMIAWAIVAIIIYRVVSHALGRKPVVGPEAIVGSKGKVVSPLEPEGLIKIGAELWRAKSSGERIDVGKEVTVVEQDGTMLIVHASD
jgi:membrane-bound ClpP family serine protease